MVQHLVVILQGAYICALVLLLMPCAHPACTCAYTACVASPGASVPYKPCCHCTPPPPPRAFAAAVHSLSCDPRPLKGKLHPGCLVAPCTAPGAPQWPWCHCRPMSACTLPLLPRPCTHTCLFSPPMRKYCTMVMVSGRPVHVHFHPPPPLGPPRTHTQVPACLAPPCGGAPR
jgi:hypothetical protein